MSRPITILKKYSIPFPGLLRNAFVLVFLLKLVQVSKANPGDSTTILHNVLLKEISCTANKKREIITTEIISIEIEIGCGISNGNTGLNCNRTERITRELLSDSTSIPNSK